MARIRLAYGRTGYDAEIPDANLIGVLRMKPVAPVSEPAAAVARSLEHPIGGAPLAALARGRRNACIIISDITRPVPNRILLPPILEAVEAAGVPGASITILIGTGIHRPCSPAEIVELVGEPIALRYRIINHDSRDPSMLADLGTTSGGVPIELCRHFVEADLKIVTGHIEPHLMAGYSGGRKGILPGIASVGTMRHMHGFKLLSSPFCRYGQIDGNPFHDAAVEVARRVGCDFCVNVTLDENRNITGVFSGDVVESHLAGCRALDESVKIVLDEPVDVAITSSGGYPLDQTFYQAIKGIKGAMDVVKPGGTILCAAKTNEGIGGPEFTRLIQETPSANQFMTTFNNPGNFVIDQWQIQELCMALERAEVYYYTDARSPEEMSRCLVQPIASVEEGIERALAKHGRNATMVVIPDGPYVITQAAGASPLR